MTKPKRSTSTRTRARKLRTSNSAHARAAVKLRRSGGKLTLKQERFISAYILTANGRVAYRAAYDAEAMSDGAVDTEVKRLLKHPRIALRLDELRRFLRDQLCIDAERVLTELARIAFCDVRKAVHWGPPADDPKGDTANQVRLISADQVDDDTAAAIAEVSELRDGFRIKFHDKLGALDKLARHLKLFESEGLGSGNVTIIVEKLAGTQAAAPKLFAERRTS